MSIASEILRLQTAKADIKNAIESKGVAVAASKTLDEYAALIDNISGSAIDWESIARGMIDFTTQFSMPVELITNIPDQAYRGRVGLQSIELPNTLTSIGTAAFRGCTSLTEVIIPNSVTTIEKEAFASCTNLTTVSLSTSLTEIKDQTFQSCSNLKDVVVPDSVTRLGSMAFYGCNKLSTIDVGTGITSIGGQTFYHNYKLTMIIRATTPPTLYNANTSLGNANSLIYVPDTSVAAYKAANGWSTYSDKIYPISEYTA